jgi:hypothetical protein
MLFDIILKSPNLLRFSKPAIKTVFMAIPSRSKGKSIFTEEIKQLKKYLYSESNEDAKRPLLYPFFQKLNKDKFRIESDACGADVYIEGQIIVEAKTHYSDWLDGFYQALHYHKKHGLVYSIMVVIAHKFVGIWRVNQLPEHAVIMAHTSDAQKAPNAIGKENARKTAQISKKLIKEAAIYWLEPKDLEGDYFAGEAKSIDYEVFEILNILRNTGVERLQMNTRNFIEHIELLKKYFEHPIDAVHAFYSMVAYWDITSTVSQNESSNKICLVGFKGQKFSDEITIKPTLFKEFKKFVETRFIFTNEGSGLTVDYYFSRFDEVISRIDPEYVKQHGIFFTDINLSKFALWYAKKALNDELNEQYIFFDPAGGSGNLISSWRGRLKHKIISELQPDLLRIIERRMKIDPWHIETGFTIIPKTADNEGLNFLDCEAGDYLRRLEKELKLKNLAIDKPLAFLLNPPYKNTDEHESARENTNANYSIHPSILELTGEDAGKERYLAFLGQILNISKIQAKANETAEPLVLIFTPTSWLIPRPTYVGFRKEWDKHFSYLDGFIITSNEFFKLQGKWPLAFTIWKYKYDETRTNNVVVADYSHFTKHDLNINWNLGDAELDFVFGEGKLKADKVALGNNRIDIRESIPFVVNNEKVSKQTRYNIYRNRTKFEEGKDIVSGFALKDDRHFRIKAPHGFIDGTFVGFMDDNSPVRLRQETSNRLSNNPDRVWLQLRPTFIDVNLTKVQTGPADKYGYCAYDFESAKALFTWFCITKAIAQRYPLWANQSDIWVPAIKPELEKYWNSLCFAFVLAENRCVVTTFEQDNPVPGAPEVFVDNPLCPANPEAFWATTLDQEITADHGLAFQLVKKIKLLYKTWNLNYCKGQYLRSVGLKDEPYFRYFDYEDFLTPYSGLIQIRKYAEKEGLKDIHDLLTEIHDLTKKVREELYRLLVEEFRYFE